MTLKEQIYADYISAYKERNMPKKTFLGVIKGEIENLQGRGVEINDNTIMDILKKMEKSLKLTNDNQSNMELEFLQPYLPKMLSENEIRNILTIMKENGIVSMKDIMTTFARDYKGLVDNKLISQIINEKNS